MKFFVTSDANWESKIDKVLDGLVDCGIMSRFEERGYWGGLNGIAVVLVCRDPGLSFKRRVRFSKKERVIYLDIIFDLNEVISMTHPQRMALAIRKLREDVSAIVSKFPIEGFDLAAFTSDFESWLDGLSQSK